MHTVMGFARGGDLLRGPPMTIFRGMSLKRSASVNQCIETNFIGLPLKMRNGVDTLGDTKVFRSPLNIKCTIF
jgi:hypothetical protein